MGTSFSFSPQSKEGQVERNAAALSKWTHMKELYKLRPAPFEAYRCNPRRMGKFLRRLKLGPPAKYRWEAWLALLCLSGKIDFYQYRALPLGNNASMSAIRKDLPRTYPEEPYFRRGGQQALERVLGKLAGRFPSVGYCQSMNYIAGFLLLVSGGKEVEVFCIMDVLLTDFNLQGFFREDMYYLKQSLWVFNKLLKDKFPVLSDHLEASGVVEDIWVLKWFMTGFTVCFNLDVVVRLWDYFLIDKVKALFQVSLGIIGSVEHQLLQLDTAGLCTFFKNIKQVFQDPEALIQFSILNHVPYSDIKALETMYVLNRCSVYESYRLPLRSYSEEDEPSTERVFHSTQKFL